MWMPFFLTVEILQICRMHFTVRTPRAHAKIFGFQEKLTVIIEPNETMASLVLLG